jgi:hypothetical protein
MTAHFILKGKPIDQCTPDPKLSVGDFVPAYGFKPSSGPVPRLRVVERLVDYQAGKVTYTVEKA